MMNAPEPAKPKEPIVYSVSSEKITVEPSAFKVSAVVDFELSNEAEYRPSEKFLQNFKDVMEKDLKREFPAAAEVEVDFVLRGRRDGIDLTISNPAGRLDACRWDKIVVADGGEIAVNGLYDKANSAAYKAEKEQKEQEKPTAIIAAKAKAAAKAVSTFAARHRPSGSGPRSGPRM